MAFDASEKTVLMVDDEVDLCEILQCDFEDAGFQTFTAYQALNLLENHSFDLVISDIRMPGGEGLFLLNSIRQRGTSIKLGLGGLFLGSEEKLPRIGDLIHIRCHIEDRQSTLEGLAICRWLRNRHASQAHPRGIGRNETYRTSPIDSLHFYGMTESVSTTESKSLHNSTRTRFDLSSKLSRGLGCSPQSRNFQRRTHHAR